MLLTPSPVLEGPVDPTLCLWAFPEITLPPHLLGPAPHPANTERSSLAQPVARSGHDAETPSQSWPGGTHIHSWA